MNRICCWGLSFSLVMAIASSTIADDAAAAKEIVEKAIEANGGTEKLEKYNAMTFKSKGTFYGMGGEAPFTGNYAFQFPDQFLMNIENVFTIVVDGDQGWVKVAGNTIDMTKDQIKETQEQLHAGVVTTLVPLLEDKYTLSTLGETEVDGKPTVGIKVSSKDHRDVKIYFNKDDYMLTKSEYMVLSEEEGKEVNQEELYRDYKKVDGVPVPQKSTIYRDGKKYVESEMFDIELKESLEKSIFAKP